jgi:FkbM family methyltransferase
VLSKFGIKPLFVIDRKFESIITEEGTTYLNFDSYRNNYYGTSENYILIISFGSDKLIQIAQSTASDIKFKKIITAFEIFEYHLSYAAPEFVSTRAKILSENSENILKAYYSLSDAKSRAIFRSLISFYFRGEKLNIPADPIASQYFPADLTIQSFQHFINCGSFDGDTIRQLHNTVGKIVSLVCIEPDTDNFSKLVSYVKRNREQIADRITLLPCGLWSSECVLAFEGGSAVNSSISEYGDTALKMISLDNVLLSHQATYLNMDIEGSELAALEGAKKFICQHEIEMAIAIYHRPQDLWTILNKVLDIKPGFTFFIRNYTGRPAETVLYCLTAGHEVRAD